ncbi:MAG: S-layer homology domain-containing protein [Clostridia bacterium]
MTNFNKVLSLTLASATLLSTVAGATFTDNDEITLSEAVETLVALNVIQGYEDGSFRPENTVTRAEMAKMIFTIKNGGSDDASSFAGLSTSFTDIGGHWAEGYIKYCQTQGIIAGKSDSIFDPDSEVTGTEALKMSLVVLGYQADKSGLIDTGWEGKTLALALESGLTEDYIGSFAGSAQRQSAAQILYNALYTETVKYSNVYEDYSGTDKTLAETAMNLSTYEDVYISDSDVKTGLSFTSDAELETKHSASPLDIDRDLTDYIGQKVDILADTKTDTIYGFKVSSDNQIIRTYALDVELTGSEGSYEAEFDGVEIEISDDDYTAISEASDNAEVYIIDNGDAVVVTVTEVIVGEVTFVNSTKINVSVTGFTAGQLTFKDDSIDEDVAKEDYVQIIKDEYNNNYTVEILKLQTGTVEAKRTGEFRIDGNWYSVASGDTNPSLNTDVSFYAVGSVIYNVDAAEDSVGDYAYVIAVEQASDTSLSSTHRAKIIKNNGDIVIVDTEIYEIDNLGKLVEYDLNSDDEYTFEEISSKDFTPAEPTGNIFEDEKLGGYYVSNDAVVFVTYETDEQIVISGELVNDWDDVLTQATSTNVILYTNTTNGIEYVELAYIDLGDAELPNEVGTETYGYVVDEVYSIKEDGTTYYVITVFDGEDTYEIKAEKASGIVQGDFVQFERSDDYAEDVVVVEGAKDQITGYASNSGRIIFATAGNAEITDDSVIIYVDSDEITGVESGSIDLATDVTGDEIVNDNVFVLVKDGEVVVMFVDVNNNMQ